MNSRIGVTHRPPMRMMVLAVLTCGWSYGQVNVLTANYDNARTNANLQETQLTPSTVTPSAFGKLGTLPVDGQVYAQPLFVSSLQIPGRGTRDVVYIVTEHNSVYAYDANTVAPPILYWHVNLGASIPSSYFGSDYNDVTPEIGILGTGVIDPAASVLYVVANLMQGGASIFQLHALDLTTGQERMNGPVTVNASVPGHGASSDGTNIRFDPTMHIQRPGLLLANGAIYIGFGSHADFGLWHGWLMSYSAADLNVQLGAYNISPEGQGGSIWQSGRGLAADENGNLYFITGNGDYDGASNFGESFLKVDGKTLKLTDWYTPANEEFLSSHDYDLSAGPGFIPGTHMLVGGDKYGDFYLVNGDSMGHQGAAIQSFPGVSYGSIFNFAVWSRSDGAFVYLQERGGPLMTYQYANGSFKTTPVRTATNNFDSSFSGLSISANGGAPGTGILWIISGDHSKIGVPARLHAFDATTLQELWNSDMNQTQDGLGAFPKFVAPTVVNGKVYTPTFSGTVVVYGMLPAIPPQGTAQPAIAAVESAGSYMPDTISPGEMITIFGANLGPLNGVGLQLNSAGLVATTLSNTQVMFDGVAAPMIYAGPNQVSAVVPFGLVNATSQVQVQYQGTASDNFPVNVAAATPSLFTLDSSGVGQAAALNQDGSINQTTQPAAAGSVIVLYATGGGQLSPAVADGSVVTGPNLPQVQLPVTVTIGGQAAQVLYSGSAPGQVAGVLQINAVVPGSLGSGTVSISISVGDQASQHGTTVAIQ